LLHLFFIWRNNEKKRLERVKECEYVDKVFLGNPGDKYEIIVVDDGSDPRLYNIIYKKYGKGKSIKLLSNKKNLGFAKTVNKGIAEASGGLICLLNNDIRLPNPAWLKIMVDELDKCNLDMTAPAGGRADGKWNYQPGEAKKKDRLPPVLS